MKKSAPPCKPDCSRNACYASNARHVLPPGWARGQLVAFGFIVIGIFRFFGGAGFGGLWLVFIGWFLLGAARTSYAQLAIAESLRGLRVLDVMTKDCPVVSGRTNLQTLVEEHLMRTGNRCFVVEEQGRITGQGLTLVAGWHLL